MMHIYSLTSRGVTWVLPFGQYPSQCHLAKTCTQTQPVYMRILTIFISVLRCTYLLQFINGIVMHDRGMNSE